MLQNVDTVIAFAGIMLTLSLTITVLVQAAAAAFELRNLIASLAKVLIQIEPALRDHPEIAKEIVALVSQHPSLVHYSETQARSGRFSRNFLHAR